MRSYRYLHFDVFTDHLFGGNQLAVFLYARGLAVETMQAIAKEMNFSETTFVLPPEASGTDARLRIFTPGEELPTARHPTIGSTSAFARRAPGAPSAAGSSLSSGCSTEAGPVRRRGDGAVLGLVGMRRSCRP